MNAETYIKTHSKSLLASFLLTLLFGPLGLFYSSWIAGLILAIIAFVSYSTIIGPLLCWILSIAIGLATVSAHNSGVRSDAAKL